MIDFLIIIIGIVTLLFFETLFMSLGLFSILLVVTLLSYSRTTLWKLLAVVVPVSIALDVTNHMIIGSTLAILLLVTLIFQFARRYLPLERIEIRGLFLLLISVLYYVLYFIVIAISTDKSFGNTLNSDLILLALKMSLLGTFVYLMIEYLIGAWSGRGDGISIGKHR
jgi:hypothetical protein